MDYFDKALNKTKEAFGVAKQKTTEADNIGKQKYEIAVLEKELEKLFTKLGKTAYSEFKDSDGASAEIKSAISAVSEKQAEIKKAKEELLKAQSKRVCPNCSAPIDENSAYCSFCGSKVTFTE